MILGELAVILGVKADTFTVRDFSRAIGDIPLSVASAITSMAGLSFSFAKLTQEVLEITTGFSVFTATTGMNTRALDQWQQVAKQAGLSGDIVTQSMMSLSALMAQMNLGRGLPPQAAQALGYLGFSGADLGLSPDDMLRKIQAGAQGKNPAEVSQLLRDLGIPIEMARVFQTPSSVREGLSPTMSAGEVAQMAEFQRELAVFNQTTMKEFVDALVKFEPYMADFTQVMTAFISTFGSLAGYSIGETATLINTMRKQGGVGNFMDNLITSGMSQDEFKKNGPYHSEVNVTQHIHSTADPMAVADEAARLSMRAQNRKAASDIQNRGNR